jgi:hypothetical protein
MANILLAETSANIRSSNIAQSISCLGYGGSVCGRGTRFFPSLNLPCRFWGSSAPMVNEYGALHAREKWPGMQQTTYSFNFIYWRFIWSQSWLYSCYLRPYTRTYIYIYICIQSAITYDMTPYTLHTSTKFVTPWRWPGYMAETCSFVS